MRVLVVADVSAEKVIGGAERMLVNHVRALLADGHDMTLLTRQLPGSATLQCEIRPGVVEHRLPYSGSRGMAGLRQLQAGAKAWWREHAADFDVVIAEQPFTMWALLRAGCRLPRLQVVHSFAFEEYATRHGLDWSARHWLVSQAMFRLEKNLYHTAQHVLVLSDYMRRRLGECFGLTDTAVSTAVGGVDVADDVDEVMRRRVRETLGWDGPVVVTLRNLVPRTGVDLMVQAAAILRHEMPELHWCVMGEGLMLEPLRELAEVLGVSDCVEFTGYVPEAEVSRRMEAADVFMLPTRSLEGFGLVTVEANANGLPVVATPVGANPEVVTASPYNRLAESVSPQALADAVKDVLSKPVEHGVRAAELRAHCQRHFAWQCHDERFLLHVRALTA